MKVVTKNLLYFAVLFFIGAILFRYALSYSIEYRMFLQVWGVGLAYFFYNFFIGWYFGKRDYEDLPLYDIGFRFHFTTYLLHNSVSLMWFHMGFQSKYESISVVYLTALFWGIGLLIHYALYLRARRNTINGINREDIFE